MSQPHDILAVIFDFDDTLVPDSTTRLLKQHGIDADRFWSTEVKALITAGYDPALAYLKLFLDNIAPGKPLAGLTNADLRAFGTTLDKAIYPGLPGLFKDLKKIVQGFERIEIEFFIISGGLEEVIKGSQKIVPYMAGIYGCKLAGDSDGSPLRYIKRCISFTEKTRYVFEINKGIKQTDAESNPQLVNKDVEPSKRRIPFRNMVYVGDGLTDIPCFSLVQKQGGGKAFGIFKPGEESSAKRALLEFLNPHRVVGTHKASYRKADELGSLLRSAIATRCSEILVERAQVK